jgi:hypothetical protein
MQRTIIPEDARFDYVFQMASLCASVPLRSTQHKNR